MSEQTQDEQLALAAQDDFESGFSGTRSDAPAAGDGQGSDTQPNAEQQAASEQQSTESSGEPAESQSQEQAGQSDGNAEQGGETPVPQIAGLPEDQVRSLLAKAAEFDSLREDLNKTRDTLHGKFGELNRTLQALQQTPTASAAGVRLQKEAFKRISELWGDEFAEAFASDLSEAMPAQGGAPEINWDEHLNPRMEELEQKITTSIERRRLLRQHSDFYDQIQTPEFKLWIGQQPAEDQTEFMESIDSDYLGDKMTAFKTWRESLSKKRDKQALLENNVRPRGASTVSGGVTDEQAFEAGFYGNQ